MIERSRLLKISGIIFIALLVNTSYVAGFPSPTLIYMSNVALHVILGLLLVVPAVLLLRRIPALGAFLGAAAAGIYLMLRGNTTSHRLILWVHILLGAAAVVVLIPFVRRSSLQAKRIFAASCTALVILPLAGYLSRRYFPNSADRIRNPLVVPTSMKEEGGGPKSPFFPSSSKTNVGGIIPSNFFMDSKGCADCHKEIYDQWNSSAHHFASFNNQFYRKSIEYMQDVIGTKPSKWCAGCHDHAVFFNGRFDRPIKEQMDTPEAQNGLGCMSCHAIVHIDSSMGNAGFTMAYPPMHELANSKNPLLRNINHFLTYLNPEPHRRTFLKPFMVKDSAEFCSTCHKVHLDVPVNNYRWFRGFNDYDNWQASGVSGQGARSFYYPKTSLTCSGCHMPMVKVNNEPAADNGMVHSHRFPGANTALAYVNEDKTQMDTEMAFLKSGFISVDIFAASPVKTSGTEMVRRGNLDNSPQAMSGFAVGEEAEQSGPAFIREVGELAAPIDHAGTKLEPGSTARVDVVVRTRKIGHFFPGGTVDAFDVWLELKGEDATGKTIFWSGSVEANGKGPVEPGAHFYRSYQLDAEGNPINKRNAWQARSVLYVRLIPPGAADVAHYRVKIPKDAKGPLKFTAKLNYRKFSHYYTQFSYAGEPKPGQDPQLINTHFNSAEYSFDRANIPSNVAGRIKDRIPDLPIVTVAESTTSIPLGASEWKPVIRKTDRERWNDWGIGLLLQGDLKGAEYAFRRVTEAEPGYADGWLNVARTLIQEGETDAAKPFIAEALKCDSTLGRIYYFRALIDKADGDYDAALKDLQTVIEKYPRDRVALNQKARIQFLKRDFQGALATLQQVCLVDPEDLQMHYTAMLCYRGLRQMDQASREEKLFRRFKAEESSQSITFKRRMASAEDNNERQPIHEHENAL
jgi:tetratricopeptide (TPR) repeat protein